MLEVLVLEEDEDPAPDEEGVEPEEVVEEELPEESEEPDELEAELAESLPEPERLSVR